MNNKTELQRLVISLEDLYAFRKDMWERYKNNYSCPLDSDIEKFLKNNAERADKYEDSKTHLILDANNLGDNILAYFSLTIKEIPIDKTVIISKTLLKKLHGLSSKPESLKGYFITQLGKDSFSGNPITMDMILEEIYDKINDSRKNVGGRLIFLECKNIPKLIDLYKKYGFNIFKTNISSKGDELIVMFKAIDLRNK